MKDTDIDGYGFLSQNRLIIRVVIVMCLTMPKPDVQCVHIDKVNPETPGNTEGCEECEKIGSDWVHLRLCLTCGHVGCCNSSPNKHGTKHFVETGHPIIRSYEPGEDWKWCFIDDIFLE
jgi:uncharacterized UBP type Zn finger protein